MMGVIPAATTRWSMGVRVPIGILIVTPEDTTEVHMVFQRDSSADPAEPDSPAADPRAPDHDEWLIDESLAETFPASDPPSSTRPGSIVGSHYAAGAQNRALTRALATADWMPRSQLTWAMIGCSILCVALLLRRRGR
jgi:hypothetical protein